MITILFLSANPKNTDKLQSIKEYKEINDAITFSAGKNLFKIEQYHDISFSEFRKQLLLHKPQIVHFTGHGSRKGELILQNENGDIEVVSSYELSGLFEILGKDIFLVFLNVAYSQKPAKAIAKHVNCVIGMSNAISDVGARKFAVSFYSMLGFGKSIKDAFDLAVKDLKLFEISEATPQMCIKEGVDPSKLFCVNSLLIHGQRSNICKQLDIFNQQIDRLKMRQITPAEFFQSIYSPVKEFCTNSDNKERFGELKIKSLNLLTINLSTTIQEIEDYKNMDDMDKAKIRTNKAIHIADEINQMINDLCMQT